MPEATRLLLVIMRMNEEEVHYPQAFVFPAESGCALGLAGRDHKQI